MLYTVMGAQIVLHDSKHVVYICGYICSCRIDSSLKSDQQSGTPGRDIPPMIAARTMTSRIAAIPRKRIFIVKAWLSTNRRRDAMREEAVGARKRAPLVFTENFEP